MSEQQNDRLRLARLHKGFAHPTDAARAFGWVVSTYISHENGNRGMSIEAASRYANAFGVNVGWLLSGENPPKWSGKPVSSGQLKPMRAIPRLNFAELSALKPDTLTDQLAACAEKSIVAIDPALGTDVFELTLEDDSMAPDFKVGERIAVDPAQTPKPGDFVVAIVNGVGLFRRLRIAGFSADGKPQLQLQPLNDAWPPQLVDADAWIVGKAVLHTRAL